MLVIEAQQELSAGADAFADIKCGGAGNKTGGYRGVVHTENGADEHAARTPDLDTITDSGFVDGHRRPRFETGLEFVGKALKTLFWRCGRPRFVIGSSDIVDQLDHRVLRDALRLARRIKKLGAVTHGIEQ